MAAQDRIPEPRCQQCRKPLNPVEALLATDRHGTICPACTRKNHKAVTGRA